MDSKLKKRYLNELENVESQPKKKIEFDVLNNFWSVNGLSAFINDLKEVEDIFISVFKHDYESQVDLSNYSELTKELEKYFTSKETISVLKKDILDLEMEFNKAKDVAKTIDYDAVKQWNERYDKQLKSDE